MLASMLMTASIAVALRMVLRVLPLTPFLSRFFFFFQAEDGIRDSSVTGVQTCALPISNRPPGGTPLTKKYTEKGRFREPVLLGAAIFQRYGKRSSSRVFSTLRLTVPGIFPQDEFSYRAPTSSGTSASLSYSSSDKWRETAATFCSRCSIEEVPGIGSMMGDRRRSQASATCMGLALCACAIWLSTSPAILPAPSGNQGIKAIPWRSQYSTTQSQ